MNGRVEQDKKTNNKTAKILNGEPKYMKLYANNFINKTAGTKYNYIRNCSNFLKYLHDEMGIDIDDVKSLNELKQYHFNNYLGTLKNRGDAYKANIVYALKNLFEFLYDNEFIDKNPAEKVKAPKDKKVRDIVSLTPEEVDAIEKSIQKGKTTTKRIGSRTVIVPCSPQLSRMNHIIIDRNLALFTMGIMTGMRISELININIDDIDLDKMEVMITEKGGYERKIFLPKQLKHYLKDWINSRNNLLNGTENKAFFLGEDKERITYNAASYMIEKNAKCIDKHITPHKMRSTYATNLYDQTGDIYLTAQGLGHHNIQNTKRYARISEQKERNAADVIGNLFSK